MAQAGDERAVGCKLFGARDLGQSVKQAEPSGSHRPQTDSGVARERRVSGTRPRAQTPSKQASKQASKQSVYR